MSKIKEGKLYLIIFGIIILFLVSCSSSPYGKYVYNSDFGLDGYIILKENGTCIYYTSAFGIGKRTGSFEIDSTYYSEMYTEKVYMYYNDKFSNQYGSKIIATLDGNKLIIGSTVYIKQ